MQQYKKMRQSPFRQDSLSLRESGNDFLYNFTHGVFTSPSAKKDFDTHEVQSEDLSVTKRSNLKRSSIEQSTDFVEQLNAEVEMPRRMGMNQ